MGRPRAQLCDLGVWGLFDTDSFGAILAGHITERELRRRLPAREVRRFAPLGGDRGLPKDPGEPPSVLGAWTPALAEETGRAIGAVVIDVGDVRALAPDAITASYPELVADDPRLADPGHWLVDALTAIGAVDVPVVWQDAGTAALPSDLATHLRDVLAGAAVVAVRDDASAKVLVEAGLDREVTVVPPTALLVNRLFPPDLSRHRLDYLRTMGWYPEERDAIVLQGGATELPHVDAIAAAVRDLLEAHPDGALVLVEAEPGDAAFADALAPHVPGVVHRIPGDAGIEDLSAAIAAARAVISSSYATHVVACASQVPAVALDLGHDPAFDGFRHLAGEVDTRVSDLARLGATLERAFAHPVSATTVAALEHRIDAHFDRVAELVASRLAAEQPEGDLTARVAALELRLERLQRAHDIRGRRLVDERVAFGEQVRAVALENLVLRSELEEARQRSDEAFATAEHDAAIAADSRRQRDEALAELDRMRLTRTFRYTESMRKIYGDLLRRWP